MNSRTKATLIAILIVVLGGFALYTSYYKAPAPIVVEDIQYGTDPIVPQTLVIPKLGIEAVVEHLGKNAVGNMSVPKKYEDVSWYEPGYKPGEQGNAAIAGHVDNSLGLHGVFFNLKEIEVGDDVFVKDEAGNTLRFRVTDKKIYEYESAPLSDIFGKTEKKRLNLITCIGEWDSRAKTYRERLIVHTELVEG